MMKTLCWLLREEEWQPNLFGFQVSSYQCWHWVSEHPDLSVVLLQQLHLQQYRLVQIDTLMTLCWFRGIKVLASLAYISDLYKG